MLKEKSFDQLNHTLAVICHVLESTPDIKLKSLLKQVDTEIIDHSLLVERDKQVSQSQKLVHRLLKEFNYNKIEIEKEVLNK